MLKAIPAAIIPRKSPVFAKRDTALMAQSEEIPKGDAVLPQVFYKKDSLSK